MPECILVLKDLDNPRVVSVKLNYLPSHASLGEGLVNAFLCIFRPYICTHKKKYLCQLLWLGEFTSKYIESYHDGCLKQRGPP